MSLALRRQVHLRPSSLMFVSAQIRIGDSNDERPHVFNGLCGEIGER
jgi:hypothetical protein